MDIPRPPVTSSPVEHLDVPGQRTADPAEADQPFDTEAGLYRWVANLLNRWIGRRAAHAVGWILVAGLAYLVLVGSPEVQPVYDGGRIVRFATATRTHPSTSMGGTPSCGLLALPART